MKQDVDRCGYMRVHPNIRGRQVTMFVHRFVALAFIPNPNNLTTVDHIDGNKKNNNISNLQWLSNADNIAKSCAKHWKFVSPEGVIVEIYNLRRFCKENNLQESNMRKVYIGKRKSHKGWTI